MQVLLAIQDASGTVVLCDASRTMKPPCFHPVNALEEFSDGGFEAQVLQMQVLLFLRERCMPL